MDDDSAAPTQGAGPAMPHKPPDSSRTRRAVWSRHWASGAAHSCVGSFADHYQGAFAETWKQALATLAPETRVLDIGTGSGAIPRLMTRLRPTVDFSIDAVDMAEVVPGWIDGLPSELAARLRFHSGVAAENLPFPDASFGLVTSQYGLEYSHLQRSVPELLRVLAPGGRVELILHHAESRPVTLAVIELAHIDRLYAADGLLPIAREMLAPMARAATPEGRASLARDPAADDVRRRFNAAQSAVSTRAQAAPDGADVLVETQSVVADLLGMAQRQGQAAAESAWSDLDQGLTDARWRLQELHECALNAEAAQTLCESLRAHGLRPLRSTVVEQGHLMGWHVSAG